LTALLDLCVCLLGFDLGFCTTRLAGLVFETERALELCLVGAFGDPDFCGDFLARPAFTNPALGRCLVGVLTYGVPLDLDFADFTELVLERCLVGVCAFSVTPDFDCLERSRSL
jgi:hypothetical protein